MNKTKRSRLSLKNGIVAFAALCCASTIGATELTGSIQTTSDFATLCADTVKTAKKAEAGKKDEKKEEKKDPEKEKKEKYEKLIKDCQSKKGLFTVHFNKKDNKLYWEMPEKAFERDYLLANRLASTSNPNDFVAGQMIKNPVMLRFSKDENRVYMHLAQVNMVIDPDDPIYPSYKRNYRDPILKGFEIKAENGKNVVIDMSAFFGKNESFISPLKKGGGFFNRVIKGSFNSEASCIQSVKTFPKNIEIETMMSFSNSDSGPYTLNVHRSFCVLPEKPMKARPYDTRIGIFFTVKQQFDSSSDKMKMRILANRWRIEPRKEDMARYFRGELVQPEKQIVFYVDPAFPAKWRPTVKAGIEVWNKAFEAAGFKNVVVARDYPKNDPSFDPDDMRYNCVKYCTTTTQNAMGPSYVDPRSGEILVADVIWYHNVVALLHNWRFAQTAAVDERVRKATFDDEVMCESLKYAISHEVGHTMGLMHNMGASYSFPVEKLRDPKFTQKYGTTPSIMDYARNNYIAQPGDMKRGVKLTPPEIGVYDIFAIDWNYRIFKNDPDFDQQKEILGKWLDKQRKDPMFVYGPQQFMGTVDPSSQNEDLGDDHMKAGDYAVANLKVIMKNFYKWTEEKGERYDSMMEIYDEVVKQYERHIGHVMPYIGGEFFTDRRQGDKKGYRSYVPSKDQHRAASWLMNQARTYEDWLCDADIMNMTFHQLNDFDNIRSSIITAVLNNQALYRIYEGHKVDPKHVESLEDYLQFAIGELFKPTFEGKALSDGEKLIQSIALGKLINFSGLKSIKGRKLALVSDDTKLAEWKQSIASSALLPCYINKEAQTSFWTDNSKNNHTLPECIRQPIITMQLKRILKAYNEQIETLKDQSTVEFYKFQAMKIEELITK